MAVQLGFEIRRSGWTDDALVDLLGGEPLVVRIDAGPVWTHVEWGEGQLPDTILRRVSKELGEAIWMSSWPSIAEFRFQRWVDGKCVRALDYIQEAGWRTVRGVAQPWERAVFGEETGGRAVITANSRTPEIVPEKVYASIAVALGFTGQPSAASSPPTKTRPTSTTRLERFTAAAKTFLVRAQRMADDKRHRQVELIHLLAVLAASPEVGKVFRSAGLEPAVLLQRVQRELSDGTATEPAYLSGAMVSFLARVGESASASGAGVEDLLRALVGECVGRSAAVLHDLNIGPSSLDAHLHALEMDPPPTNAAAPPLFVPNTFMRDVAEELRARLNLVETGASRAQNLFAAIRQHLGDGAVPGLVLRETSDGFRMGRDGAEVALEWNEKDAALVLRVRPRTNLVHVERFRWAIKTFVNENDEDVLTALRRALLTQVVVEA